MSVFEVGHFSNENHKYDILNQLVMQYLDEPFYDELRTKQ